MQAIPHKSLNPWAVGLIGLVVCLPVLLLPAGWVPWALLAMGALAVGVLAVHAGQMLALLLVWLAVTSVLGVYFWVGQVPGFFNVTIDRIALIALVGLFALAAAVGLVDVQRPRWPGWLVAALVAWLAVVTQISGWTLPPSPQPQIPIAPPYYRFFAGFLFPAVVFFMAVSAVRRERHIRTVLLFFTLFGLYLTITGLAEKFGWSRLVWPRYILDPEVGIHVERIRGPFVNAPDMGLTLVLCLFANLLLMTKVSTARAVLLGLISLPMPVLIFWTLTRSIWLAFVMCAVLAAWLWPRSRSVAKALLLLTLAGLIVAVFGLWPRLSTPERERGGVTDPDPIISRYVLAGVSLELARLHPVTGVGLARFPLEAPSTTPMRRFASRAAEYGVGVEHNNFLSMLAETGIPGAALYAAVVFGLLAVSVKLYRLIPATATGYLDRRFIVFYWIAWLVFFVDSMFRLTTASPFPNTTFMLLGGVIVGLYHRLRPQPLRPTAPTAQPAPLGPAPSRQPVSSSPPGPPRGRDQAYPSGSAGDVSGIG